MKFKVGDRVRVLDGSNIKNYMNHWTDYMQRYVGREFTVSCIKDNGGVKLQDVPFTFDKRGLQRVRSADERDKIVITTDGKRTVARYYVGKRVVLEDESRCNPANEFSFRVGAALAVDRLIDKMRDDEQQPKELFNGRVVCILDTSALHRWKVGKIYEVKNGIISDDYDNLLNVAITSVNDLNECFGSFGCQFIQIVD